MFARLPRKILMAQFKALLSILAVFLCPFKTFSEKFENHRDYCVVGAGPGGMLGIMCLRKKR